MKTILWSGLGAALLLGACAKYDGREQDVGNQGAIPANAASNASVPIVRNESGAAEAAPPVVQAAPTPAPVERRHVSQAAVDYRALGTEPFWAVTVRGDRATLERPGRAPLPVIVTLTQDRRAMRYIGEGLTMTVTPGPCSDGMGDTLHADRVQIAFDEGTLKGCGGPPIDEAP
jgi:uncharacterized membrane protein